VLDAEIVYLAADGRPEFSPLLRGRRPQYFYAFDPLWLGGKDVRRLPLVQRKQLLRRIVPLSPAPVLYADHYDARGTELFRVLCENDLDGIVARRKDGLYTA
jgi:bifunctional non-homologous end joining protein LigD